MAIVRPQRQVTRFFIPLIDVMILLFCIFLLMPFVSTQGVGNESADNARKDPAADDPALLKRKLEDLQAKLDDAAKDRQEMLNQLPVRLLEVSSDSGKLFYKDGQKREEIKNDTQAEQYILKQKRESGQQEVYFVILYPNQLSGFPLESQRRQYEQWFAEVPHTVVQPVGEK